MTNGRSHVPPEGRFCSHNEWDPLVEVVVGSVLNAQIMAFEPSLGAYFEPGQEARRFRGAARSEKEIAEAERQLDGLAGVLESRGIKVRRPELYPAEAAGRTPDFAFPYGNSYACPRDVVLMIGETMIEAPMAQRARFFEYRGYRPLFREHFAAGGRWLATPKPLLDDGSFAADYTTRDRPYHPEEHPVLLTPDPCFDAASFTRCGRDIFWQPDMVSNASGVEWLHREIGDGYRIHRVEFDDRYPQHIDTTLVPLRPGLAMLNPDRPPRSNVTELFTRSGWKLITPPPSVRAGLPAPARDVSNWISLNLLVLDERTVIVESAEDPLAQLLAYHEFEVLRVPFDKVYKFGGGLHCCTVDLRREGDLRSYFED